MKQKEQIYASDEQLKIKSAELEEVESAYKAAEKEFNSYERE